MKSSYSIYIIILFLLCQNFNIRSQEINFECQTRDDSTVFYNKSYEYCNSPYSYLNNYILDKRGDNLYDQTPIYTINVKVHVIQYSANNPRNYTFVDSTYIRQGVELLDLNYKNLQQPTVPSVPPVPQINEESDSRIRFKVHSVDFIQDVEGWAEIEDMSPVSCDFKIIHTNVIRIYNLPANVRNSLMNNRSCLKINNSISNNGSYMFDRFAQTYPTPDSIDIKTLNDFNDIYDQSGTLEVRGSIDKHFYSYNKYHSNDSLFLHIYFVRNSSECYMTGFGQAKGIPSNALRMVTPGDNEIHLSGVWEVNSGGLLAHEIGHCLGLYHTMTGGYQPSYINDIFRDTYWGWLACNNYSITNNILGYNTCRDYLSPLQIADIRRVINTMPIIRNTIVELRESTNHDVIITEPNTVWEKHEIIGSNLIIENGGSLTIKCKVHFSPDAKVIVKQGGKLIIDGGLLTNEYGDFWQGIQVYGTTNKNQFPENNPTYQGLLVIKNGGIIENAHLAASNWKVDDYNSIGGVIQTNNAIFRNNRRDVAFMSYQNYNPNYSSKYRNLSKFTNTDFVTDDDFIEKGLTIQTHVTMWQVDGITFTNCHFSNDITVNKNNSSSPNRGIYSIDAGYTVGAGCSSLFYPCPTANLLKSSFNGLGTAIEATGAGTTETVTIQQADFTNNVLGITISDFDNVSVNRNNIDIGDAGYTLFWPLGAGILLDNSTGHIVEENKISTNLPQDYRVAINVNNSGTDDNRIYKNDLSNLQVGTQTAGVNYNNINPFLGLQFLCNKYSNNLKGINVTSSSSNDGVRTTQGTINLSSGNTFMNNTLDFNNDANIVFYYHNYGNTQPTYLGNVLPFISNASNTCPTSFGGGIVMKPILLVLDSLNTELGGQTTSYNDLNFTYTSLIDNGNTEQFKGNIELNWSNDAWLLRSKLLSSSPYLSSDVLLEAAKQNVLPNGMLLEILLANPDATRGEKFINELKEATNNTFPDYMLGYVRGNYNSRTLRTDMEGQLSAIHSELSNTRSWIKHLTKSKEEYANSDRFDVVNLGDEIYNKVGVMDYYISNGEFNKADSVLSIIHNDKNYKTDLVLIENFGDYINFRESLGNRNLAQLDSTEIAYLQTLANNKGRVAGYAQNILCFFYDICYEKELPYGNPQNKAMMIPNKNNQEELNNILYNIKIYPNPAKDYASIQWEIYDELKDANYRVIDLNGKEQLNGVLSNNKGEQVLDTRKLKNGVYIIGVYNNNQLKVSKKLIVENQK